MTERSSSGASCASFSQGVGQANTPGPSGFKVGDRVRIKDSEAEFAEKWGLSGHLTIRATGVNWAEFEGRNYCADLCRLEHVRPAIDPAKKYQTRDGKSVTIITTTGPDPDRPLVIYIPSAPHHRRYQVRRPDGTCLPFSGPHANDLVEVKPDREGWVNVYDRDIPFVARIIFATKDEADTEHKNWPDWNRIACIHLKFREGDGL